MIKYFTIMKLALLEKSTYSKSVLCSGIFYIVILTVFVNLWKQLYLSHQIVDFGISFPNLILYFVISQILISSYIKKSQTITHEVRSGNLAYRLLLPVNYIHYHLFDMFGQWTFAGLYFLILGISYLFCFYALPHFSFIQISVIFVSIFLACLIDFYFNVIMGVLSFWFEESYALDWLYQKMLILLGGAIAPVDIFPDWLQGISTYLPFQYIIYEPAKLLIENNAEKYLHVLTSQCLWVIASGFFAHFLFHLGKKKISINGG